jgi:hypothetical protein
MSKKKPKNNNFVMHSAAMLKSPAFRVLSLSARKILSCIEIEHCNHAGKDNGKLPVTHENYRRFGIHHHAIGPALREVVALGAVEITQQGIAGNADHHRPNLFRLTYLPTGDKPATDEWRRITTIKEAKAIAASARASKPKGYPRSARKPKTSQCRETQKPMPETRHWKR